MTLRKDERKVKMENLKLELNLFDGENATDLSAKADNSAANAQP